MRLIMASSFATSTRYLDEFLRLDCAGVLAEPFGAKRTRMFPNPKEITESFSAFHCFRRCMSSMGHRIEDLTAEDAIICVGDGSTPRTAALFAFRVRHVQCFSIDPALAAHTESAPAVRAPAAMSQAEGGGGGAAAAAAAAAAVVAAALEEECGRRACFRFATRARRRVNTGSSTSAAGVSGL